MLLIVGTVRLPAANLAMARPVMAEMVEASRREAGCLSYSYAEDLFDPGLIHVSEQWASREALDRHFASDHLARWRAAWAELGLGERSLHLFQVAESEPI